MTQIARTSHLAHMTQKNTHITLDTKNMCNTLGTNDKKARLSRWTYMTHHITSHWAHMTQRTRLIH